MAVEAVGKPRSAPRVTVVTPTYNRADLVALTIRSVLDQTFQDFEYLIIDDGSSDATAAVVQGFRDPRICYLRHENCGEAATTNRGWAMARGEYFATLSSDDLVTPDWLERLVSLMDERREVLVAYPDYDVIDGAGRVQDVVLLPDYDRKMMVGSFRTLPGVGALIRRSGLQDLTRLRNPDYRHAPDLDTWLRLGMRGPFLHLPEGLGSWRSHAGSITVAERNRARAHEFVHIAQSFFAAPGLPADVVGLRRFAMGEAHAMAEWVLRDSHPFRAALYLRRSYRISPAQPPFVLPCWRRPPRPGHRAFVRLLAKSLRHRAVRGLRAVATRLPARFVPLARRVAQQLGLVARPVEAVPAPAVEAAPVAAVDTGAAAPAPVQSDAQRRLEALMPQIREDLMAFRHIVAPLSPTVTLLDRLRSRAHSLAAPPLGLTMGRALERLPARIDHLLVVPWISGVGGSETVTARLIESLCRLRGREGLCVLAPDGTYQPVGVMRHQGLGFLGLSDVDPSIDDDARQEILDRILIQRRPRVVHCVNSRVAWQAFRARGRHYAEDSALFANIYSDIRLEDGAPGASYYYDFLPHCIEHLSGVFADNRAILRKAAAAFGIGTKSAGKMHLLRTPVIGLNGRDPGRDLQPFRPNAERRSLWLSRIAREKRLDVLARLAARVPARLFEMHGHSGAAAVDLGELEALANIAIAGAFRSLDDVAMERFDSYVFTTSGEGMPVALLEVAARGLPVVAPDLGGIGEFVTPETGWLVPAPDAVEHYVDALAHIASAPDEARRRVHAAQALLMREYTANALDRTLLSIPGYVSGADGRD